MFENPRGGRQARNFTTNVPKMLDLKSSSEQIFSENCRWMPLICLSVPCLLTKPYFRSNFWRFVLVIMFALQQFSNLFKQSDNQIKKIKISFLRKIFSISIFPPLFCCLRKFLQIFYFQLELKVVRSSQALRIFLWYLTIFTVARLVKYALTHKPREKTF